MYDPTFGPASLSRHLRKNDFKKYPSLKTPDTRAARIREATHLGRNGFRTLPLRTNDLFGNSIYQLTDIPSELVLRKAAENLRKISDTKQSNRFEIINRLKLLCEENLPFFIAKFDISQFYESIDFTHLKFLIKQRLATAPATRSVLSSFLDQCEARGISGLPRGLAISAELSELYMKSFDTIHRTDLAIHLYTRYVDDIIIISRPKNELQEFEQKVMQSLPCGLRLNKRKTKLLSFNGQATRTSSVEHEFDYLGFKFCVYRIKKKQSQRKVILDIAESKVKKRKTRIICTLLQYIKDGNFSDLRDRIKLITCNYRFFDHKKSQTRLAGLYHAYYPIDLPSASLAELDDFLTKIILSNNGKVGRPLSQLLTIGQKQEPLRFSFQRGFEKKTQFAFSPSKLKRLIGCWKYV